MKQVLGIAQDSPSDIFWGVGAGHHVLCPVHGGGTWTLQFRNPLYTLGPGTNVFTSNTTRDTYFTANADILALYNADRTLLIESGTAVQRRNAAGDAWETATGAVKWAATTSTVAAAGDSRLTLSNEVIYRFSGGTTGAILIIAGQAYTGKNAGLGDTYGEYDERP